MCVMHCSGERHAHAQRALNCGPSSEVSESEGCRTQETGYLQGETVGELDISLGLFLHSQFVYNQHI